MIKRARLSHPIYPALLAIAGLLFLSHFALARIRAAGTGASIHPSAGKPLVNLRNPHNLPVTYTGPADAVAALQRGNATPTALAAADFEANGAVDVVAGYSTKNGGLLVLHRGNPDAFAPRDTSLYEKAMHGSVASTFLPKAGVFKVPVSPDMIVTGDFNRDANMDVLVAVHGGALYLLAGDGHGNLLPAQLVPLNGEVMAMAAAPDGHVAVSIDGGNGPQLKILAPSAAGLTESATHALPARGDSVAWGSLGGGADLALGADANVVMIYNALGKEPQTETVSVPFLVRAITLGDFIWDRDGRTEIAALAEDGTIHILQHGNLDTRPLTAADIPGRRAAMMARSKQPHDPTALGPWNVAKDLPFTVSSAAGHVSPSAFSSPRLAASSTHDLMVLDSGRSELNILDTSGKAASTSSAVSFSRPPIAALALPQKINAEREVVVLTSSQAAPMVMDAGSDPTFNVTTTADEDDVGACTNTSTVTSGAGSDDVLSLREAVCEANNSGAVTSQINVPAGTYLLDISTFGGGGSAFSSGELQVGMVAGNNITIMGAGASTTIIKQINGTDRVIEGDELLKGNMPLIIQGVTLTGGNCTDTSGLDCMDNGGGAVLAGGPGDNLTITGVVFSNNNAGQTTGSGESGGALAYVGPTLVMSGSTFSSNTSNAGGGAAFLEDGNFGVYLTGSFSITNSTFNNNTAVITGGGIDFSLNALLPATISGSTFTGNKVTETAGVGGAIGAITFDVTNGIDTLTMSNSRIVGNSAPAGGTGFSASSLNATITNNWWGCNAGPGGAGCDSISIGSASTVTSSPFLVLRISANPTSVNASGTSALTADLAHNSAATGGFSAPDGTPVTFADPGTLGGVNPTAATLTSGTADSTYTAGGTAGTDSVSAKVDNQTIAATISILDSVTVTTSPVGLSFTVDSVTYTAPQSFNWVVGSLHSISTTSPQNVAGGSEQVFSSWSDTGAQTHTVSGPTATTTYTANFTTQYQLTTQASPAGDGTVTPTSGGYFASGASIPVTATANGGFQFSNWTSTGGSFDSSTAPSTNFTMPSAAATVTGNFAAVVTGAATSTTVTSNNNPSFTTAPGDSVTLTATVSSTSTVNEGTVTFTDGINNLTCSGGNPVAVSNGVAQCTTSFTVEGAHAISASYSGTVNFQLSSGNLTQVANNHTAVTGNQFCNQGPITVPSTAGAATPYPSNIFVSSLPGSISSLTLTLSNISSSDIQQTDLLLVGPTGAAIVPFANEGDVSPISGVNITLDDAAGTLLPSGSPLTSGTFRPTSRTGSTSLLFPAPAPTIGAGNYAVGDGTATLTSQFGGTSPNGTWALYAMDHSGSGAATVGGGWCLNITTPTPVLSVIKSHTGTFTAGQTAEWDISVSNIATGTSTAGTATVTDTLPAGFTMSTFTGTGWGCSGTSTVTCTSTQVVNGGSSYPNLALIVNVPSDSPSSVTNTASAFGGGDLIHDNLGIAVTSTDSNVPVNPAAVQITITTSPANLLVSVDGGTFTAAPLTETWDVASSHTIATTSPQAGATGVQYVFNSWSDTGAISHSITVPSTATTYTANFTTQYQLTTAANPTNGGTVSPTSGNFYNASTVVPVSATPNTGFNFSSWTGPVASPSSASTTVTMSAPESVTANFVANNVSVSIKTSPTGLLVSVDGGAAVASPVSVSWQVGSSHTIATTSPQIPVAGTEYTFANWSDAGAISHSIMVPSTATTYTATFNTLYQLTTAANPSAGGTVTPASGSYFAAGTKVNLTATSNAGYVFSNWTGPVASSTSASTTVTMSAPESVTANFGSALTVSTSTLNFGTLYLGQVSAKSVTLTNKGTTSITISIIKASGGTAPGDYGQISSCAPFVMSMPGTLGAGKSCTIIVGFVAAAKVFSPKASTSTLTITDSAAGSPQTVALTALVINPQAKLSATSISFPTTNVGATSAQKTVTVTNNGNTTLTFNSVTVSGNFKISSPGCSGTLAPTATCTMGVEFMPTARGLRTGTLKITDNALSSPQTVSLSGTGH